MITIRFFWIVTVQKWTKISLAIVVCPLRKPNCSNVIDIDNLVIERIKNQCFIFDNHRDKLAKICQTLLQ